MAKPEYFDSEIGKWIFLQTELSILPVDSRLDWTNGYHKGYRWGHFTKPENQEGMFHLSQLSYVQNEENSDYTSTRLLTFNENSNDSFAFYKPILMNADLDMQGNQITNFSIDVGSGGVTGELLIAHLEGYPNSSSVFLRGDGTWAATPGIRSLTVSGSSGLNVSGSPVTGSTGTINLTLGTELQSLSELNTTGFLIRTGAASYETGAILGTEGQIEVANGSGIEGDPVLSLAVTGVTAGSYTLPSLTVDATGRITSASNGTLPSNLVTGPSSSTSEAIALYSDNTGTVLKSSPVTISPTGLVSNAANPVSPQDVATKNYVDSQTGQSSLPAGTMLMWAGSSGTQSSLISPPLGYLWCDGRAYISTDYPNLYAAIQKNHGFIDYSLYASPFSKKITLLVSSNNVVTAVTALDHNLQVGDVVTILNTSNVALTANAIIKSTPSSNEFTYAASSAGATSGYYQYVSFVTSGKTLFNVPDTRGMFPRGTNSVNGVPQSLTAFSDPNASQRLSSVYGGNSGDKVGSYQTDIWGSHVHPDPGHVHAMSAGMRTGYSDQNTNYPGTGASGGGSWTWGANTGHSYCNIGYAGGAETRPRNFSINFIIKT